MLPPSPLRPRLAALSVLVALLLVALSSRLWYLQVLAGERYGDLAEGNRVRQVVVEAPRGRILDAHGRVVVRNRAAWAVTVKPSELGERRREVLGRLARLLGTTRARLEARIADYTGSPLRGIPVAEDVPTRQLFYLTEHADRFPGVAPEVLALREYPAGPAAAHVLGYVGEISPDELKARAVPRVRGRRHRRQSRGQADLRQVAPGPRRRPGPRGQRGWGGGTGPRRPPAPPRPGPPADPRPQPPGEC